eukprot:6164756-Prymnesium_polylepis.1
MDRCLPRGSSRDAQMWRAGLTVAFCGLLSGGEVGLPDGVSFSALYGISRPDLRFLRRNGKLVAAIKLHVLKGKVLTCKTVARPSPSSSRAAAGCWIRCSSCWRCCGST